MGKRIVSIPATLLPDLSKHMETYAAKGEHGHVFVCPKGAKLRRANFTHVWAAALKKRSTSTSSGTNGHATMTTMTRLACWYPQDDRPA